MSVVEVKSSELLGDLGGGMQCRIATILYFVSSL